MPHETLMMLRVPNLAGVANREIRRDLRARLGLEKGAKDATPSAAAPATTTAASSATASSATASSAAASSATASARAAACSRAAAACSRATAAAATATAAGREGGRGERETSDQQSRAERRNEAAALLAFELKKSTHREILQI
jgi:hypothetical protein